MAAAGKTRPGAWTARSALPRPGRPCFVQDDDALLVNLAFGLIQQLAAPNRPV